MTAKEDHTCGDGDADDDNDVDDADDDNDTMTTTLTMTIVIGLYSHVAFMSPELGHFTKSV